MEIPTYIRNHEAVLEFFGRWPVFHDANVFDYRLDFDSASLELTLHAWLMTDQVDAKGYFILRNHALVAFRFSGLHDVCMEEFQLDNILYSLEISPCAEAGSFRVELESVMDRSGSFSARHGEVVSVVPCAPDGGVMSP